MIWIVNYQPAHGPASTMQLLRTAWEVGGTKAYVRATRVVSQIVLKDLKASWMPWSFLVSRKLYTSLVFPAHPSFPIRFWPQREPCSPRERLRRKATCSFVPLPIADKWLYKSHRSMLAFCQNSPQIFHYSRSLHI